MNVHEALALLELPPNATVEQVRAQVRGQYRLWSNRVASAPTVAGRQEAERRVEMLDDARRILEARDNAPASVPHQQPSPRRTQQDRTAPNPTPQPTDHHQFPQEQLPPGWYVDATNGWRCTAHQAAYCTACYFPSPSQQDRTAPNPTNPTPQPADHNQFPQKQLPPGWYVDATNSWCCTAHQTAHCSTCYFPGWHPAVGFRPPKSRVSAGVLGLVLGSLGIHRFYLGYNGIGAIMLVLTVFSYGLLLPVTFIWGLIEGLVLLTGGMSEKDGRSLQ